MTWQVTVTEGPAGPFHGTDPPADAGPMVWVRRIPRPALVLGSAQPDELVRRTRAEADGIEVCRRRSGGGLVFIDPEADCWIDLVIPRSSRHWDDDVAKAFHWVGDHWASVLSGDDGGTPADAGATPPARITPTVHRAVEKTPAGALWCFADLGHGEVSIGGSKVVGLSQRRTRSWLRIQSLVLARWPGELLARYVDTGWLARADPGGHPDPEVLDPAAVSAGFPAGISPPGPIALAQRFVAGLPPP